MKTGESYNLRSTVIPTNFADFIERSAATETIDPANSQRILDIVMNPDIEPYGWSRFVGGLTINRLLRLRDNGANDLPLYPQLRFKSDFSSDAHGPAQAMVLVPKSVKTAQTKYVASDALPNQSTELNTVLFNLVNGNGSMSLDATDPRVILQDDFFRLMRLAESGDKRVMTFLSSIVAQLGAGFVKSDISLLSFEPMTSQMDALLHGQGNT